MQKTLEETFDSLQKKTKIKREERTSFYTKDPVTGNVALHGATNKRPKAYAGDVAVCPWDDNGKAIIQVGEAFLAPNDFPALNIESLEYPESSETIGDVYDVSVARGQCFVVIYTQEHNKKWFELSGVQHENIVNLWAELTKLAKQNKEMVFTHIFENIGSQNSMTHPHGQQYNLTQIPPKVLTEIENAKRYYDKTGKNLFEVIRGTEIQNKSRVVIENDSFIAFCPPGAEWPLQIRILPKRHVIFIEELNKQERVDLAQIITKIRKGLDRFFSESFKPTIMMNLNQAPYDNVELYNKIYSFRVEFYNTALSKNAEKLMFSVENSTGLKVYSSNAEESAAILREFIK